MAVRSFEHSHAHSHAHNTSVLENAFVKSEKEVCTFNGIYSVFFIVKFINISIRIQFQTQMITRAFNLSTSLINKYKHLFMLWFLKDLKVDLVRML